MRSRSGIVTNLRHWVPRWWRGEAGRWTVGLDLVLVPAEMLYRAGSAVRNRSFELGLRAVARPGVPVISVGNLTVGGAGKTPVAAWLAARLGLAGRHPAIILRGYGADEVRVHRELNPTIPVYASARRIEGIQQAMDAGADAVIMDDAFQHRAVARDADVVLVGCEQWTSRRRLLPRGPWREPLSALRRADFVLITRKSASWIEAEYLREELQRHGTHCPVGIALLSPAALVDLGRPDDLERSLEELRGRRVLAVTTLADPDPFLTQLSLAGAEVDSMSFPDHHEFTVRDIREIEGRLGDRLLVTTRKEAVKLRGRITGPPGALLFVEQRVEVEVGADELDALIRSALERHQ